MIAHGLSGSNVLPGGVRAAARAAVLTCGGRAGRGSGKERDVYPAALAETALKGYGGQALFAPGGTISTGERYGLPFLLCRHHRGDLRPYLYQEDFSQQTSLMRGAAEQSAALPAEASCFVSCFASVDGGGRFFMRRRHVPCMTRARTAAVLCRCLLRRAVVRRLL